MRKILYSNHKCCIRRFSFQMKSANGFMSVVVKCQPSLQHNWGNKSAKIFHKIFLVLMSRRFALKTFLSLKFFKVKANTKYHLALNPKKAHVNVVYAYLTKLLSNDFTSRFSDIVIKIICIYLSYMDFVYHEIMKKMKPGKYFYIL